MKMKHRGFTLAEILITLTIIGVIAAILFPSVLANYNTRTLNAKRSALVARMSQAMAMFADHFRDYEDVTCDASGNNCVDNGSALKFLTNGLSKSYKISATCDERTLSSCDIATEITRQDGSTVKLVDNSGVALSLSEYTGFLPKPQWIEYDTKAAGFRTANGESILIFYYPRCTGKKLFDYDYVADTELCVNMVYDLNGGKNKPNRVGDDIGFISTFYSNTVQVSSPKVVIDGTPDTTTTVPTDSTIPVTTDNVRNHTEATKACKQIGENIVLPSREQAMAISANQLLLEDPMTRTSTKRYWTAAFSSEGFHYQYHLYTGADRHIFLYYTDSYNVNYRQYTKCVYDNY